MLEPGLEPGRPTEGPADFKSAAYTDSATRAAQPTAFLLAGERTAIHKERGWKAKLTAVAP
jgi:hypothetical protein